MAFGNGGVAFGAFYDEELGGALQVEGKNVDEIINNLYKWKLIGYGAGGSNTTITITEPFNEVLLTLGENSTA